MYVDDIKLAGKRQNLDPMWKVLNKEVDLGEPTSFLDHVYLGCTQRQCKISKDIVDNYRTMFESRISAVRTEKQPYSENLRISSWSYDMAGHAKKCVERYCELANKTTQQLYKVSTPCIDDHHFKEEELKSPGELSVTKWTQARDRRLTRAISYIHHTSEYRQFCHVGTVRRNLKIISLDAGLRMDGISALDVWDLVVMRYYTRHLIRHTDFSVYGETPSLNKTSEKRAIGLIQCRSCLLKREFFSSRCHTLHF